MGVFYREMGVIFSGNMEHSVIYCERKRFLGSVPMPNDIL